MRSERTSNDQEAFPSHRERSYPRNDFSLFFANANKNGNLVWSFFTVEQAFVIAAKFYNNHKCPHSSPC